MLLANRACGSLRLPTCSSSHVEDEAFKPSKVPLIFEASQQESIQFYSSPHLRDCSVTAVYNILRRGPIEQLSIELRQLIMSAITDVQSLKSAALSCPSLYYAFSNAETIITTHMLFNQIGCDVPLEAVAALESSRLRLPTKQGIQDFVVKYLCQRCPSPRSFTLRDALSVGNLHLSLYDFATRFANACLTKEPLRSATLTTPIPDKRDRINRALYRFEIFCNLFHKPDIVDLEDQRDLFFSNFSPWENEQLACVHDFLV
jgi:hypothetical protein